MTSPGKHLRLPVPAPYQGPARCQACAGGRISSDGSVIWSDRGAHVLVIDVLCPVCDGCGRATHDGCSAWEHADWDDDWEGEDDDTHVCYSCHGRRWFPVQGWTDDSATTLTLRMPCGCATDLLVEVA